MSACWRFASVFPSEAGALSGAVMGAAATLGYAVTSGAPPRSSGVGRSVALVLPVDLASRTNGRRRLGLLLCKPDLVVQFDRDDAGRCVLRIGSATAGEGQLAVAGRELAGRICQQSVYHRVVLALRRQAFTIIERWEDGQGTVTIRGRLPVRDQMRHASRTAHPQFSMRIDAVGEVTVDAFRLPPEGVRRLEAFLHGLFAPETATVASPRPAASRPARVAKTRVHAA